MANILRMDIYRLVRSKSLWICLASLAGIVLLMMGTLGIATSPGFLQSMQSVGEAAEQSGFTLRITGQDGNVMSAGDYANMEDAMALISGSTTQVGLVGMLFFSGGGIGVVFALFIAIFLATEFESGFSKNVFSVRPGRLAFLGARALELVVLAALFVAFATGCTLLAGALFGIGLVATPVPELLLWCLLATLVVAAFGVLTALSVWLTRKMAVGIAVGIAVSAGVVTMLLQALLMLFPHLSFLADFTLFSCAASLGEGLNVVGGLPAAHIAGVALVFFAVGTVLCALALKKKDI